MSTKFKIGDKIKRVCESNHEVLQGFAYTVRGFDRYGDLELEGLEDFGYNEESFELVTGVNSQPTHTQSELSYIKSLEDEVAKLEELCSDYSEHVKDVEYKLEQHNKALDKWVKLAHLVSQNAKVADLIGASLGDDVIDKIHDYLLSRAK